MPNNNTASVGHFGPHTDKNLCQSTFHACASAFWLRKCKTRTTEKKTITHLATAAVVTFKL